MCQKLVLFTISLLFMLASSGGEIIREKVKGLTKDGATEFALQKGVSDCGTDSNATLCGRPPVTWVMSEECKNNPVVKQSCSFSCSPSGQLQGAAWRGSNVGVEKEIAAGADPLCQKTITHVGYRNYETTAIHLAALANQYWIVKKLLDVGVDVNLQTTEGITPTHDASRNGSTDALKILIEHNANVDLADIYGWTPLIAAAVLGQLSVAKSLINANASIDVTGGGREATALFYAAHWNNQDVALLLLQSGADPMIPDKEGVTPAAAAGRQGHNELAALIESYTITGTRNWSINTQVV